MVFSSGDQIKFQVKEYNKLKLNFAVSSIGQWLKILIGINNGIIIILFTDIYRIAKTWIYRILKKLTVSQNL